MMYSFLVFPSLIPIDKGLIALLSLKPKMPWPVIKAITAYAPSHLLCVFETALNICSAVG